MARNGSQDGGAGEQAVMSKATTRDVIEACIFGLLMGAMIALFI